MSHKVVPVQEEFDSPHGTFTNYDSYSNDQKFALARQRHVDIRTFESKTITTPVEIIHLNTMTMAELDSMTMEELEGAAIIQSAENWKFVNGNGELSPQADRNNWNGLKLETFVGTSVVESIGDPVDIETGFDDDDFITVALPAFPLNAVSTAESSIAFTSNPDGDFEAGPTAEVVFEDSLTPLVDGDSEFRFKREELSAIDLSSVTGVRFTIQGTASAEDFRVLAVRLVHKDWAYAPFDFNTSYGRGVRPVSLDGSVSPTYDFPSEGTDDFPILWRADDPAGASDPTPVDAHLSVFFNTGTMAEKNTVSLFFRERGEDLVTMLELDGTPLSELNGKPQPDFGEATYAPRVQQDLNGITQAELNGKPQFDLERKPDPLSAAYIEARLTWGDGQPTLEFYDAENPAAYYTFTLDPLEANTNYVIFADVEGRSGRVRIYTVDRTQADTLVFDSTEINDVSLFKRRRGRLGWRFELGDGDAYVDHVRPRHISYAEYRSQPYESLTPVVGAQLQVGATEDSDLFQGIYPGPWGGQFTRYPERGPEAFRVRNTALKPLQGIQTQQIFFDDFASTQIEFDLLVTQEALDAGSIYIFLWDGYRVLPLPVGPLNGSVWNHVQVDLSLFAENTIPGYYSLAIVQAIAGLPNDWIVDKIRVNRRNISWCGRSYVPDAWNLREDDWIPFKSALNDPNNGIVFKERTKAFQIRAQALRQDVFIGQVRAIPKYAELGRIVWEDEGIETYPGSAPTASFDSSVDENTVTFTSTSTDENGYVAHHAWTFGDGAGDNGKVVTHTYKEPGTYPVTLVVTDNNGERSSITKNISTEPTYEETVLGMGPSLYWTLDAENDATDLSGNGHDGTGEGGVTIGGDSDDPLDRGGTSTAFDGADDRVVSGYGTLRNLFPTPRPQSGVGSYNIQAAGQTLVAETGDLPPQLGGGTGNRMKLTTAGNQSGEGIRSQTIQVTPGASVAVGLFVKAPEGEAMAIWCQERNDEDSFHANTVVQFEGTGEWQWVSAHRDFEQYGNARFNVVTHGGARSITFYAIGGLMVEGVSGPLDYFDGDGYTDDEGRWHSDNGGRVGWTGTPHASPSDMGVFANGTTRTFTGWAYLDDDTTWHTLLGGDDPDAAPLLNISDSGDANFWPNFEDEVLWEDVWPGTGEWVHWALVFDESEDEAELFINGESQGVESTNLQYVESPGNFQIAAYTDGTAELWDGKQAHVAVFERALTPQEIAKLAQQ